MSELSPSQFFGRGRVTRQALKPKPLSTTKENVDSEVNTWDRKSRKGPVKEAEIELKNGRTRNLPDKSNEENFSVKRGKRTVDQDIENRKTRKLISKNIKISEQKKVKSKTPTKACDTPDKNKKTVPVQAVPSGPVYRNVRRSDVVGSGDPLEEYDFQFDENSSPVKKKRKPRKINPSKETIGSRCNFFKSSKGLSKIKSKGSGNSKPVAGKCPENKCPELKEKSGKSNSIAVRKPEASKCPGSSGAQTHELDQSNNQQPPDVDLVDSGACNDVPSNVKCLTKTYHNVPTDTRFSSPFFMVENQFTSTPVPSSSSVISSKAPKSVTPSISRSKIRGLAPIRSATSTSSVPSISPRNMYSATISPSNRQLTCTPGTAKRNLPTAPTTVGRGLSPITLSSINVRQSPSFKDPEPTSVSPPNSNSMSSSLMPTTPCSKSSEASVPTPLSRSTKVVKLTEAESTPTVHFAAHSQSLSLVTSSPVPVSETPARPSWTSSHDETFSGLFDDIPQNCKVSLPTRMFTTYRGTIFAPDHENNVTKRKLPQLSPDKADRAPRVTAVKFSVAQPKANAADKLDDCFGFDDEEDAFVPQPRAGPSKIRATRAQTQKTKETQGAQRQLPIQEVQALLMGHTKPSTPGITCTNVESCTPRSIQTKLTDFVSSTPVSTPSRPALKQKAALITPTPVPLFGEEQLHDDLPSPFVHVSTILMKLLL